MKAYASESYYIGVYLCGKEPDISAAFDFYAMQATSLMKRYTLDNVDENDIPEEVKMCCCEFEFDNQTPQSISESMKMFRAEYDFVTVMSIDDYMFGGLPHMEVSVK